MSATTVGEYFVIDRRSSNGSRSFPYAVFRRDLEGSPSLVDLYRTRSGARYACRLLNNGAGRVNSHGVFGCRVEVM
jgi:hypothetical protein